MTISALVKRTYVSWTRLPVWVLVWVFLFLGPVNAAPFFMLDTNTGKAAAIAAGFVMVTNCYLMIANGGVSKVMAIPHLMAWIPLVVYLLWLLIAGGSIVAGSSEFWLALLLVLFNGISIGFDFYDTQQWRIGNRAITGFPDVKPRY